PAQAPGGGGAAPSAPRRPLAVEPSSEHQVDPKRTQAFASALESSADWVTPVRPFAPPPEAVRKSKARASAAPAQAAASPAVAVAVAAAPAQPAFVATAAAPAVAVRAVPAAASA